MRAVILVLVVALSGCDSSTLDPFDNDDRYFTVFGFLDHRQMGHAIRVIPITRNAENIVPNGDGQANIDADVSVMDLETGEVTYWKHNLESLADGTFGHVFRGELFVRRGSTYRLEIKRTDGKITSAETTVPFFSVTKPVPDTLFFSYDVSPDSALTQTVFLPGIFSPWSIHLDYFLGQTRVRVPYGRAGRRVEGGWEFTVDPAADAIKMREILGVSAAEPITVVDAISLDVRTLSEEWDPPHGDFDPELLAQPGVMSNVEQGYGIWSGIGSYQFTWTRPPR